MQKEHDDERVNLHYPKGLRLWLRRFLRPATAWFHRMLRNALIDRHRREASRNRALVRLAAESEEWTADPDPELEAVVCACVTALVETLKPEYGVALRRVELDGMSVRGYAKEAGITPPEGSRRGEPSSTG